MSRMTPERLAEIEGESVEFELVDALKAERKRVEELEAEVAAWKKREEIAYKRIEALQAYITLNDLPLPNADQLKALGGRHTEVSP